MGIYKVWTYWGYEIYSESEEPKVEHSDDWFRIVVNTSLITKQKHICYTRKQLRDKLKHNKQVEELKKYFHPVID